MIHRFIPGIILFTLFQIALFNSQATTPASVIQKLIASYPDHIKGYNNNCIIWKDNTLFVYDDSISNKSHEQLLNIPDIQDQFTYSYNKGLIPEKIDKSNDPGRIRNEAFFKKMYGRTEAEVRKNLVEIIWCPKLINQKIKVTKVNGIDKKLQLVSKELDEHFELKEYIKNIGGTFNWRKISGTDRSSMHSFGMTIDINIKYSNYWQWDCRCKNENAVLHYKNRIPQLIIDIFEKHGFIWGGKWYHYDTMHFEYRPELL